MTTAGVAKGVWIDKSRESWRSRVEFRQWMSVFQAVRWTFARKMQGGGIVRLLRGEMRNEIGPDALGRYVSDQEQ